ncbi:MAG: hypothetical protein A2V99_15650 [Spirochaetes bacterium RBG_16_67_19]|nr:MAG: hypothetical protein A2V99_15650 [Spirochaetes bacterium RBG_16_67_19]
MLAALLLGSFLARAWPLEVSEGRLKLVLHAGIGRFSLYLDGIALFVDQDPRTSGMSLLLDNRVYKLGDSGEFKESSEALPGGARFTWTSKRLTVTQTFSFQGGEAVAVSVTIRNNTDREVAAGLRFLLDTYLGEAGFPHFRTERDKEINGELSFTGAEVPAWWLSRSSRASRAPENPGLLVPLRGEGITTPDRLILANWKRLAEASWLYETAPGRTFSELPYSINDSAACLYFGPAPIAAGASRTYLLALSGGKEPAPAGSAAAAPAPAAPATAAPESPVAAPGAPPVPGTLPVPPAAGQTTEPSARKLGIEGDLRVLDDLLQKLAQKMDSRTVLSEEERQLMEQIIADIKKRLESYGD